MHVLQCATGELIRHGHDSNPDDAWCDGVRPGARGFLGHRSSKAEARTAALGLALIARASSQIGEGVQVPAHLFLGSFQNAQKAHQAVPKAVFARLVRRISAAEAC